MGGCVKAEPSRGLTAPRITGRLLPDVSEFQGCALHSEAIIRIYEAGTDRQDAHAVCHAQELARLHVWAAAYSFLRAGHSCSYQARRSVEIANTLPGIQLIIGDAETGIRGGLVRCFLREVERLGYPAREYTCPGCGDEQVGPIWIASYPTRPPGAWIAHQFSPNSLCRGVQGDCSIDEGLLKVTRVKPPSHRDLLARRRTLRRVLLRYGCRRRVRQHQKLGPTCLRWFAEGQKVNNALRGS